MPWSTNYAKIPDSMEQLSPVDFREIPIPELPSVAGWKEVPIVENGESLIPLGPFSDNDNIFTDSIYFGERISSPYTQNPPKGSLDTMFVRQSVADQLRVAQDQLPPRLHLVVFDAYRTLDVQGSLFDFYLSQLKEQNPEMSDEDLLTETQKYVSMPSSDPTRPSPHNTGGSVDLSMFELSPRDEERLARFEHEIEKADHRDDWRTAYILEMRRITLIARYAKLLNFGTPFDWGGSEAALDYFEKEGKNRALTPEEIEARGNRRLLYHVMNQAGLEAYTDEWWHYNSAKSQMGAKTSGRMFAEFGPASLSAGNQTHEQMRVNHRLGAIKLSDPFERAPIPNSTGENYLFYAHWSARDTGDIRKTSLPLAEIIAPKR